MIIRVEKIVSRGSVALSGPPASIIDTISATSITVTARASTKVPNGSPTRCAMNSAWCTAAITAPTSAIALTAPGAIACGSANRQRQQSRRGQRRDQ